MLKKPIKNPIVKDVAGKFQACYDITKVFANETGSAAIKGLLISGDAGQGKTHWVWGAINAANADDRTVDIKAGSITAAALFCELYNARDKGNIIVLDDCDIINRDKKERIAFIDLLKGATDTTKGKRMLTWSTAVKNPLMKEFNVPSKFDFQGSIIWITNELVSDMESKLKSHWPAINSRFNVIPISLTMEQKLLYTAHLIEAEDMLGSNCYAKEGGYSKRIQADTLEFLYDEYKNLTEISPRYAIKIADTICQHPSSWKTILKNQMTTNN